MDPMDPLDAQQMVAEYIRVLERDFTEHRHPARVDSLPYAKPLIKDAIRTSVQAVAAAGQLTDELRDFLYTAYTSLAEYVDGELVQLMVQYRTAAADLSDEARHARERTATPAWRTLAASSALAGEVARAMTAEAHALHDEFARFAPA